MSLITHCPACGTTFKVVRDQLKISEGWVRCGHCTEVFDSTPSLRELDLESVASPDPVWQEPAHAFDEPLAPDPVELDIGLDELAPPHNDLPEMVGQGAVDVERVAEVDVEVETDAVPASDVQDATITQPEPVVTEIVTPEIAQAQDFSFIAKTPVSSPWHKPLVRVGLGVSALLLLLGGTLQIMVHERDRIAAVEPRARHALLSLCGLLHCQVLPLRRIEAITVDSSSFNKQRGDTYLLSFVVKNMGNVDLARPAIELTLTDAQDAPLVRRVLLPDELMAKSSVLAAGAEWSGAYGVALTGAALGSAGIAKSVAGYRVLAFYP